MDVAHPVVIVAVHHQRAFEFPHQIGRKMLQIEAMGDVPRLIKIRLPFVDLDDMAFCQLPQHIRLVGATAGERLSFFCQDQDFQIVLS